VKPDAPPEPDDDPGNGGNESDPKDAEPEDPSNPPVDPGEEDEDSTAGTASVHVAWVLIPTVLLLLFIGLLFINRKEQIKVRQRRSAERRRRDSQHDVPTMEMVSAPYSISALHTLTTASGIHQGTREYQQDTLYVDETISFSDKDNAILLGVVCDGMGGMEGGETASRTALEVFKDEFRKNQNSGDTRKFIKDAIRAANGKVNAITKGNGGTTLVSVVIDHNKLYWGSVGDSRIYILRKGEIAQFTRDHNYLLTLMEQVGRKEISEEEARAHPKKDALISFIGMDSLELIDICPSPFTLQAGDMALLCSDGLCKTLSDAEIADIVFGCDGDVCEAARLLPIRAFDRHVGSQDNISVVLIQYDK
jgi:protein phosphatase